MSVATQTLFELLSGDDLVAAYKDIGHSCMSRTPWLLEMYRANPDRFCVLVNTFKPKRIYRQLLYRDVDGDWMLAGSPYESSSNGFHESLNELDRAVEDSFKWVGLLGDRVVERIDKTDGLPPIHLDDFCIPVPKNRAVPFLDYISLGQHTSHKKLLVIVGSEEDHYFNVAPTKAPCGGLIGTNEEYSISCDIHDCDQSGHDCRQDPLTGHCSSNSRRRVSECDLKAIRRDHWGCEDFEKIPFNYSDQCDCYGFEYANLLTSRMLAIQSPKDDEKFYVINKHWIRGEYKDSLKPTRRKLGNTSVYTTKNAKLLNRLKDINDSAAD